MKITFIVGTRPELIKVAPLIHAARGMDIEIDVVNTAQHKDLLEPYWQTFDVSPTHILDVMRPGQSLASLTQRALAEIEEYLSRVEIKPDLILAQGDTTTVMGASIISFYHKIPFAHLEAGLRSFDLENPFPEEFNRRIASITANYHFCPTITSKENLLAEGIREDNIFVVGNTVIDAVNYIKDKSLLTSIGWVNKQLNLVSEKECVLVTCHRRENQGENLIEIIDAIATLADENQPLFFIWPVHPNPNIKDIVLSSSKLKKDNILLVEPLEYIDLLKVLELSICAISDSGGIQEEAPTFQTPVLVLRETTERPEGVNKGLSFLVGSDKNKIVQKFYDVRSMNFEYTENPYGDGLASQRIIEILIQTWK